MKKIGLVTIHATTNYGGVLQAFATQKVLERYGEVQIVDYRNSFVDKTMQLIRFGRKPRDVLRVLKDLFRLYPRYQVIKKFQTFIDENMNVSSFANSRLVEVTNEFDIFVTGSDQIWNPSTVSENYQFDEVFLLDFVKGRKKVAYASSIGDYSVKDGDVLTSRLRDFDHLSVREKSAATVISNALGREVCHVLDPTLLLNKLEWIEHLKIKGLPENSDRYIFIYALKKDSLLKATVKYISSLLNIDVVIVDQDPFLDLPVTKHYRDASPSEFISLLLNAEIVVTNSFHGVAFSLNFEQPFVAVMPPSSPSRVTDLLSSVGLSEKLISNVSDLDSLDDLDVDFNEATKKLDDLRVLSLQYLESSILEKGYEASKT